MKCFMYSIKRNRPKIKPFKIMNDWNQQIGNQCFLRDKLKCQLQFIRQQVLIAVDKGAVRVE